jgi:hypothetical protein
MIDVRAWTLLLVAIGVTAIVWLNRMIDGAQSESAFWASVMAALPGGCFLLDMWVLRGRQELFELFFWSRAHLDCYRVRSTD